MFCVFRVVCGSFSPERLTVSLGRGAANHGIHGTHGNDRGKGFSAVVVRRFADLEKGMPPGCDGSGVLFCAEAGGYLV